MAIHPLLSMDEFVNGVAAEVVGSLGFEVVVGVLHIFRSYLPR
jgi:hypothetical protein